MATASLGVVISHWNILLEGLQASPLEFYIAVEAAIKKREIPDVETSRIDWRESGLLSARREYLRVTRGRFIFDICGAPFGRSFFVSSWLVRTESSSGALALILLFLGSSFAVSLSYQVFGFFLGTFLAIFGLPFLFWCFVQVMNVDHEGWDDALV